MSVSIEIHAKRMEPRSVPITRVYGDTMQQALRAAAVECKDRMKVPPPSRDYTLYMYDCLGGLRAEMRRRNDVLTLVET